MGSLDCCLTAVYDSMRSDYTNHTNRLPGATRVPNLRASRNPKKQLQSELKYALASVVCATAYTVCFLVSLGMAQQVQWTKDSMKGGHLFMIFIV